MKCITIIYKFFIIWSPTPAHSDIKNRDDSEGCVTMAIALVSFHDPSCAPTPIFQRKTENNRGRGIFLRELIGCKTITVNATEAEGPQLLLSTVSMESTRTF